MLPSPWVFSNYTDVLVGANAGAFWREALNSLVIAVVAVGLDGRLSRRWPRSPSPGSAFRGREAMYTLFVFGLLFPSAVAILPLYILVRDARAVGQPARRRPARRRRSRCR